MSTLGNVMVVLMVLGILVWGLGLIVSSEKPSHWLWIELGTPIFMLYFVVTFTIFCMAEWDRLNAPTKYPRRSVPAIYVVPTYPY